MKTKTKTKKPKPQPKQKKLAPGWRHGNASLVVLIIVIVVIVAGGVGWMLARNTQAPTEKPIAQKPSVQNDYPEKWQTYTNEDLGYKITC